MPKKHTIYLTAQFSNPTTAQALIRHLHNNSHAPFHWTARRHLYILPLNQVLVTASSKTPNTPLPTHLPYFTNIATHHNTAITITSSDATQPPLIATPLNSTLRTLCDTLARVLDLHLNHYFYTHVLNNDPDIDLSPTRGRYHAELQSYLESLGYHFTQNDPNESDVCYTITSPDGITIKGYSTIWNPPSPNLNP